ncbi:hypothetical protein Poly21_51010 [Allorhodopirellula heiligendammensis]|uniref:Uncharacterized protein n=1 Tax=Allorhodopirellula heiligendammensis TaxID=2714739 RepID=A0A5C6BEG5_9BACT|nr:hypothetical protein Poly21_51010 [Allorhodopirellula heiligendammensis]
MPVGVAARRMTPTMPAKSNSGFSNQLIACMRAEWVDDNASTDVESHLRDTPLGWIRTRYRHATSHIRPQ